MPFAGLAFGFAAFAAIGLPGFANFASEIMIFFGAFRHGWEMQRFHIFQIADCSGALGRRYFHGLHVARLSRKHSWAQCRTAMGHAGRSSSGVCEFPVILLIAGLHLVRIFPAELL